MSQFPGDHFSRDEYGDLFLHCNPPEISSYILSLIEGLLTHSLSIRPSIRSGRSYVMLSPLTIVNKGGKKGGQKGGKPRLADLEGPARLTAISRALVYLRRHGAEKEGVHMCPLGYVSFSELHRAHEPLRKLGANEADVMNIIDTAGKDNKRLDSKWGDSYLYVRTF